MGTPVSTVLFDLDETLCELRRSSTDRLAAAFDRANVGSFFTVDEYHEKVDSIGGWQTPTKR